MYPINNPCVIIFWVLFLPWIGRTRTRTNRSGGIQGGISNGELVVIRVAFKPTSTISKEQMWVTYIAYTLLLAIYSFIFWLSSPTDHNNTCDMVRTTSREGKEVSLKMRGRHDPCVLPRAVPLVEAMVRWLIGLNSFLTFMYCWIANYVLEGT